MLSVSYLDLPHSHQQGQGPRLLLNIPSPVESLFFYALVMPFIFSSWQPPFMPCKPWLRNTSSLRQQSSPTPWYLSETPAKYLSANRYRSLPNYRTSATT